MKKIIQIVVYSLFIVVTNNLYAQDFLGRVTVEELNEKQDLVDPDAEASILREDVKVYFDYVPSLGFQLVKEVSRKLKIYKKEGLSLADFQVDYYVGNGVTESVRINDVNTYNLVNGKVQRSKIKSNAIFDEKTNGNWKVKKVVVPDVREGSIVEYNYSIKSDYFSNIPEWRFQRDIPIRVASYEVRLPEYYIYTSRVLGELKIDSNSSVEHKETFATTNRIDGPKVKYTELVNTYKVLNVKPLKSEPYIDNLNNYRSCVKYDLSIIRFPNQQPQNIALSEKDLVKSIYENKSFSAQLNMDKQLSKIIDKEEYQGLDDKNKVLKILAKTKASISWNERGGYLSDDVKKALEQKTGNYADVNFVLLHMLHYVGLEAYPILVSSISNGTSISLHKTSFDRIIVGVVIDGVINYVDATETYGTLNNIRVSNLNWIGVLIKDKNTFEKVNMSPTFYSVGIDNYTLSLNAEGEVIGRGNMLYKDYMAMYTRNNIDGKNDEAIIKLLEKSLDNISIQNLVVSEKENPLQPVSLKYILSKKDMATIIGNDLYVKPASFFTFNENPFTSIERKLPISFSYPLIYIYKMNISLPVGYELEYIPAAINIVEEEIGLAFEYKIEVKDNILTLNIQMSRGDTQIAATKYKKVQQFYIKMIEKIGEQVILKKK
ncbi:MAG: DUF3857 domain-containing protein [Flavobacteriaceae bacterium]|jgi:hypothetical protein|nr:DUF3857 domain-containing protein [Flavobacteriaceae bacterium]